MPSNTTPTINRRFTCAPMMDWSDRHCRYFWRLLSKHAVLYTEMVTTGALIYGDRERFLRFNAEEAPVALQLGGSDPEALAQCAAYAEQWGYSEVNLNCGCPSDRVQSGRIGACLMAEPELVRECMSAMMERVGIPVSIKHRIGIDDMEDYAGLLNFVDTVARSGCTTFIVHARKAWLQGLSPKENRDIPPLDYELVARLKQERPNLEIIVNGGIKTLNQCQELLTGLDGVMLGREIYANPYLMADVDKIIYGATTPPPSRLEVMREFVNYCEEELSKGVKLSSMTRHTLGLYQGLPGARRFRRVISENAHKSGAGVDVIWQALQEVESGV
ncbi:tRNA dihydrouridine(20/20a) synthase DusA [Gilvimarinus sp. SDUM040013]|uniref:tRNA-dihydrouridine(20/20a) synthase n=1 Tax=Gilvimarinus gilvus TaxID=3058038 RepID=A0ABU4RYS7_9GAMM|nr:tRNA dihydrouridine(20/20a) synthase DusA [Gilvimarinus sp. SDUM040013]MDO3386967.1 tRNA dihydrouridine(20/20a) synthase DusA [Gilvimarinus sp. SDUM040013]MDX6848139.1 tRNA dihydrouridine(20/20a) synthase DusA [Gilvimarinus sp. SDUM040013]